MVYQNRNNDLRESELLKRLIINKDIKCSLINEKHNQIAIIPSLYRIVFVIKS